MTSEDTPLPDDEFTAWAAQYDEALESGVWLAAEPETPGSDPLPPRRQRFRDFLQRLDQDRRAVQRSGIAPAGPDIFQLHDAQARLGRFRLLRVLGAGGFGVVYLAADPQLHREVALKVPRPEVLLSTGLRRRFVREAQSAARLNHPHVVPVFESGEAGPFCFLVSAYCSGGTLAGWLARQEQPVSARLAASLLAALASALQHAHERGVLHRDLKPANILLEPVADAADPWYEFGFVPLVADFGLAKVFAAPREDKSFGGAGPEPSLTRGQALLGTPAYMAPEQADPSRGDAGVATDVYALGAILYELLTGRPPFLGATPLEILRRVAENEPASPSRLRADVPPDLAAICLKCLEKNPERRYASAGALAEDLQRFLGGKPTVAQPLGLLPRALKWCRRRPAVAALLVSVCFGFSLLSASICLHVRQRHAHNKDLADFARRDQQQELLSRQEQHRTLQEAYARRFRAVVDPWQQGQQQKLRPLLNELRSRPDQDEVRGFAWYYLWDQGRPVPVEATHQGSVTGLAFSSDGRKLLSTSGGWSAKQCDLATGRLERNEESGPPTEAFAWRTAFTPDRTYLALAKRTDPTAVPEIHVWNILDNRCVGQRKLLKAPCVFDMTSSHASPMAAYDAWTGDQAGGPIEVRLWDLATGTEHMLRPERSMSVTDLRFSPDGRTLAVAGHYMPCAIGQPDFFVDLWDVQARRLRHTLLGHYHFVFAVAFSPDSRILASGSADLGVRVWDARTGQMSRTPIPIGSVVANLAFSPDGQRLAVAAHLPPDQWSRGNLSLWDVTSGQRLPAVLEPGCGITAVAFAPDGRSVAAGCTDGSLRLWEPEEIPAYIDLPGPKGGEAWSVAFSPDGRTLAVGYDNDDEAGQDRQTLALWDMATRRIRRILRGHAGTVFSVAFSPDGQTLASASADRTVRLWDLATGGLRRKLEGHLDRVRSAAFSPDGQMVASIGRDGSLRAWNAATGESSSEIGQGTGGSRNLAFGRAGKLLVATLGESVGVWDVATWNRVKVLPDDAYSVAFHPDGEMLATGSASGAVKLWNSTTGTMTAVLQGHQPGKRGGVLGLAFSPDGKTLASAGEDRTLRLWQIGTGAELLVFKDLPAAVNSVAFSSDGTWLAAALHDGSVRLWHAPMVP